MRKFRVIAFIFCISTVFSIVGCSETETTTTAAAITTSETVTVTADETETVTATETTTTTEIATTTTTTTVVETTTTEPTTTEITTTEEITTTTTAPAQLWSETEITATKMYVNQSCNSRETAIQGAAVVKSYGFADEVTVVARTDTDYYKLDSGAFIHQDFLSKDKPVKQTEITTEAIVTNPGETIDVIDGITVVIPNPDNFVWKEIIWDEPKTMYNCYSMALIYIYPYVHELYYWSQYSAYLRDSFKVIGETDNGFYIIEKKNKHYYMFPETLIDVGVQESFGEFFYEVRMFD